MQKTLIKKAAGLNFGMLIEGFSLETRGPNVENDYEQQIPVGPGGES
jgi:hypothetical protein